MSEMRRAIDDPSWVLVRYREAKELIDECICSVLKDAELGERLKEWRDSTAMDECTTFDRDCTCNRPKTPEQWAHKARMDVEARMGGHFSPEDADNIEAVMAEIVESAGLLT